MGDNLDLTKLEFIKEITHRELFDSLKAVNQTSISTTKIGDNYFIIPEEILKRSAVDLYLSLIELTGTADFIIWLRMENVSKLIITHSLYKINK